MSKNKIIEPKVVIIGAGSLFFGRQAIWQMIHSPHLNQGTLALVDTNEHRLAKLLELAGKVIEEEGSSLKLEGSTDRREVLKDADFVVLSFSKDTVKYRGIDCEVSEKYGIRMCSGDTIGPGGIFRTMRELPVIMECVEDIKRLCPEAWVINYINPTAVHGIALSRYAPELKSFALCDGHHMPHAKRNYLIRSGVIQDAKEYTKEVEERFDFRITGVNHFTWLLKAEYDGKDIAPLIAESVRVKAATETDGGDTGAKAVFNNAIGYELYKVFGYLPTCVAHTKEYVRYWQGLGKLEGPIAPLSIWEKEERYKRHDEMWAEIDDYLDGTLPISQYMKSFGPDHATDIIENMAGGLGKSFYINTTNQGAVTNMNDDSFLELCCKVSTEGIERHPVGEMPRGIRGMQELVLDTHGLTVEAVMEGSYDKLRRAMMTDPLVNSITDADAIIKELLIREKDALPDYWHLNAQS